MGLLGATSLYVAEAGKVAMNGELSRDRKTKKWEVLAAQ